MFRKLAVIVSLLASFGVNGAARAQSHAMDSCVAGTLMDQAALALPAMGWLQWALMALCLALFVVAYVLILFVTLRHRRPESQGKWWRDSVLADVLWTLLPLLMVAALLWPVFKPMLLGQHALQTEAQALPVRSAAGQTAVDCPPATAQP